MRRIDAIRAVAEAAGDGLIVCNLGFPSRELFRVADRDRNFYMLGSMGLASSIGLGLAIAREDRRVIAIDGDGSILMNLGSLTTISAKARGNYLLVIMDNGVYGSTGCQPSASSCGIKLSELAKAAGIAPVRRTSSVSHLHKLVKEMPSGAIVAEVEAGNADVPLVPMGPRDIISRFAKAI
ncbi:MAG TPA: sulfopyruvate decarboxylase subunit beta [Methanomassiliicoccales archaeon]|nr:sulfopyruvate decarboxylase subunit beta [Methanomassiliicoccales archaeon]